MVRKKLGDVVVNSEDIYMICVCILIGLFVTIIAIKIIVQAILQDIFDFKHGYCSKCHHKLKYVKYIDNIYYGCDKCNNFVKVKHNVIKENKHE